MRNWVIWSLVFFAVAGPACSKGSKQPPEDGKTPGAPESMKTAQPLDRGQATKPSEQGKPKQEDGAGGKTEGHEIAKVSWPDGVPKELIVDLGGGVKMEFVLIPAGSFLMGDEKGDDDEKPVHKVIITKPFYLGKYEVTQEQWQAVMGSNPSYFKGPKNPVESVSWNHCQAFLAKLNDQFRARGAKFGLPTEAQWEYACRAGTTTQWSFGDDWAKLFDYAWWEWNAKETTHPVGQKKPNAWGLYDMHGNVWEWCADRYAEDYYVTSPADDPVGPDSGVFRVLRVLRGSSWDNGRPGVFRCPSRGNNRPDYRANRVGFRVARTLTP